MQARRERQSSAAAAALTLVCGGLAACSPVAIVPDGDGGPGEAGADATGEDAAPDADEDLDVGLDGGGGCSCWPGDHNDKIYVLADDADLWTYDPVFNSFEHVALARCFGGEQPFSMAVAANGVAWILYSDMEDIFTVDVNSPGRCEDPGYVPRQEGFGLFGMAFAAASATDPCETLYLHSYSGSGPFREGPGLGSLGFLDPETASAATLGPIDFDGGELAGTGDGRLYAFAGSLPAKLVEYDKTSGEALDVVALEGFSRTNASAFAFFGGDIFLFTEAQPAGCSSCLNDGCPAAYAACQGEPICAEHLQCAIERATVTDDCGGMMPAEMIECLGSCTDECLTSPRARVSQVARIDWDESDGPGRALEVVHPAAPIRIVGASSSTCVQVGPY